MGAVAPFVQACRAGTARAIDLVRFLEAGLRSRTALAAENLFLWSELAPYRERQVKPRRTSDRALPGLVFPAHCFAWGG
jgi:hypothetical protein